MHEIHRSPYPSPWCSPWRSSKCPTERKLRTRECSIWPRNGCVLGWSDPTFCHLCVAKRPLGSLQPNQPDERSNVSLDRPGFERCSLSRRAGRTSSFLLVFLNNRGRGEELFTPLLHGGFTNHFTGSAAPCLGKSMRYRLQKVPSCTHTGTMGWRERPHPLTHGASPVL